MKVLQTIYDLSAQKGGPSTCVHDIVQGLCDVGADIQLLTVENDGNLGKGSSWLETVTNDYKTPVRYSKNIKRWLEASDYDVYHANTLWVYSTHATCDVARKKGKPYVVSPHGMLYPTALKVKPWKKWPMLKLWFNEDIMKADCLHVTCKEEMEHCRTFGYKGPIAVIPNAVVFSDDVIEAQSKPEGKRILGFLGRLDPIKKVENVLYAIYKLRAEGLEVRELLSFQIMGKFNDQYEQWLQDEVKRLGLEDCVEFVGFVSGKEKYERLSKLSALMVPSVQENFGMIVPEALICNTPVYASTGTPWEELNGCELREVESTGSPTKSLELRVSSINHGQCGWWRDNSPETIAEVIKEILTLSNAELLEMGKNGRKLMEEKYEQHKVASTMKRLYEWIVDDKMDKAKKPEFVWV